MVRTVISLPEADKDWLDAEAARQHTSMTAVVRQAVAALRRARTQPDAPFDTLLAQTAGIWAGGDGLRWQIALREEWPDQGAAR